MAHSDILKVDQSIFSVTSNNIMFAEVMKDDTTAMNFCQAVENLGTISGESHGSEDDVVATNTNLNSLVFPRKIDELFRNEFANLKLLDDETNTHIVLLLTPSSKHPFKTWYCGPLYT